MAGGIGSNFFDYKKLLEMALRRDPVWQNLADACNKVLVREVDERRRRLSSVRDSVKNRRGDMLSQLLYLPESDKPAIYEDTGELVVGLNKGDTITKAIITRVINNGNYYGQDDIIDYFEVEFYNNNRKAKWLLPTTAPQERNLLISNSKTLGFDFFSDKLSNKDYERLYEYLGNFWPDNGFEDNFIQFIGFIKNLKLDALPLWSVDDGTDKISILESDVADYQKASNGGSWYLTSHVEVRINVDDQNANYPIDLTQLEELFYLFAPVMLVLERVAFEIDANNIELLAIAKASITYYDAGGLYERLDNSRNVIDYLAIGNVNYYDSGLMYFRNPVPEQDFSFYRNNGLYLTLNLDESIKNASSTTIYILSDDNVVFKASANSNLVTLRDGFTVDLAIPIEQLPVDLPDNFSYELRSVIDWENIKDVYGNIQFSDGPEVTVTFSCFSTSHNTVYDNAILKPLSKVVAPVYNKQPFVEAIVVQSVSKPSLILSDNACLSWPPPAFIAKYGADYLDQELPNWPQFKGFLADFASYRLEFIFGNWPSS